MIDQDTAESALRAAEQFVAAGRNQDALELARSAAARFGDDLPVLKFVAELARTQGDVPAAAHYYEILRRAAPDYAPAYVECALMLLQSHKANEASEIISQAETQIPRDSRFLWVKAEIAGAQGKWSECADCLEALRSLQPDAHWIYSRNIHALIHADRADQAEALASITLSRFPETQEVWMTWADLAARRSDWGVAATRWGEVSIRFPDIREVYVNGGQAAHNAGNPAEADAILQRGVAALPDDFRIAIAYAEGPVKQNLLDRSIERYRDLLSRFPAVPEAYIRSAITYQRAGQHHEAERCLAEGVMNCPAAADVALYHAEIATMTQDVDAALVRLDAARERFGDFKALFLSSARIAARAGKTQMAISVLSDASAKWPGDAEILEEAGRQHEVTEDWPAALGLFKAIRTDHPHLPAGYLGEARIQVRLGAPDVAEAIIADGLKRFPHDVRLYVASAEIAMQRNDWGAAIERWQEAERRNPGDAGIANRLQAARLAALEGDTADPEMSPDGKDPLRDDSALMMQFESLGGADHQGCEFGLIQRAFGAEPLGLFRWTSIEPAGLIQALSTRLASVGQRETTRIDVREFENRQEYATIDTSLDAFTHNFLFADEMSRERAEAMIFTRLKFLTRKLIADLEAGEKIFVYRMVSRNLEPEELQDLHGAMRSYGDNTLLYVRYQDDDHPAGTVQMCGDGLMIGYMDRFGFTRSGERLAPSTQSWRTVCRAAYQTGRRGGGG